MREGGGIPVDCAQSNFFYFFIFNLCMFYCFSQGLYVTSRLIHSCAVLMT